MAKDAYWFKHDCNASNDPKLLSIRHIHGWAGAGMYWALVEILREQEGYKYPCDEHNLQMLSTRLFLDYSKFHSFFFDCLRVQLFKEKNGFFYSESLNNRMKVRNTLAINGSKGGKKSSQMQANVKQNSSKTEANFKHIREDKIRKEIYKEKFDLFRKEYPGTKNGLNTEFDNFVKKTKDWEEVVEILLSSLNNQKEKRKSLSARGAFVPEWKNLSTWINNRCWEEQTGEPETKKEIIYINPKMAN